MPFRNKVKPVIISWYQEKIKFKNRKAYSSRQLLSLQGLTLIQINPSLVYLTLRREIINWWSWCEKRFEFFEFLSVITNAWFERVDETLKVFDGRCEIVLWTTSNLIQTVAYFAILQFLGKRKVKTYLTSLLWEILINICSRIRKEPEICSRQRKIASKNIQGTENIDFWEREQTAKRERQEGSIRYKFKW